MFYELGFARALKKRLITIVENIDDLPFDLKSYPSISYQGSLSKLKEHLKQRLTWAIQSPADEGDQSFVYADSADLQGDLGALIKAAAKQIVLSGTQFIISLSDRRAAFLETLSRGVDVTVAVLDPDSDLVSTTAKSYSMRVGELKAECYTCIELMRGFYEEWASIRGPGFGNLSFFTHTELPRGRFYLFDPTERDGCVIFIPYADQLRSSHSPCFKLGAKSPAGQKYVKGVSRALAKANIFDPADAA